MNVSIPHRTDCNNPVLITDSSCIRGWDISNDSGINCVHEPGAMTTHQGCSQAEDSEMIVDPESHTRYLKGKLLGKGGFAKVYEIRELKNSNKYAGKIIPLSQIQTRTQMQKISREILIHRSLIHKNVVRLYHYFEDVSNAYIVLEICPRKSLVHVLNQRQSLTDPEVRYYVLQLLAGVEYIHSRKIIHKDLKPGNMLLTDDMIVKVADFGLATEESDNRRISICGTPNYIAPEVLKKESHSYPADLWAIGCILFALLVGQPPFETNSLKKTYERILNNHMVVPTYINGNATNLIYYLLNSEPKERPSLKKIREHNYFALGFVPKSLPPSCCTEIPDFSKEPYLSHCKLKMYNSGTPPQNNNNSTIQTKLWFKNKPKSNKKNITYSSGDKSNPQENEYIFQNSPSIGGLSHHESHLPSNPSQYSPPFYSTSNITPSSIITPSQQLMPEFPNSSTMGRAMARIASVFCPGDKRFQTPNPNTSIVPCPHSNHYPLYPTPQNVTNLHWNSSPYSPPTSSNSKQSDTQKNNSQYYNIQPSKTDRANLVIPMPQPEPLVHRHKPWKRGCCKCTFNTKRLFVLMKLMLSKTYHKEQRTAPSINTTPIFISKWIDYSNKYGFCFQLSNMAVGVLFNDSFRISYTPDRRHIEFHDLEGTVLVYETNNIPSALHERYRLLYYFTLYMDNHLTEGGDSVFLPPDNNHSQYVPHMKRWLRTNKAIVMELCNSTFQVNFFFDHTKVIITQIDADYFVTYINSERMSTTYYLNQIINIGCKPHIYQRLLYILDVLKDFHPIDLQIEY